MQTLRFRQRGAAGLAFGWGMSRNDSDYYLARVSTERDAAERATSEEARRAHLQLAEQYRQVLAGRHGNEEPRDA